MYDFMTEPASALIVDTQQHLRAPLRMHAELPESCAHISRLGVNKVI